MRTLSCDMRWLVVVPLLFFCAVAGAAAPTLKFKFTTIDVLGSNDVTLFAVNNSGVMVGNYYSADGKLHGFERSGQDHYDR